MGHCFSLGVVVYKKCFFLVRKNRHGIGENVAIFDWEWGRTSERQQNPLNMEGKTYRRAG